MLLPHYLDIENHSRDVAEMLLRRLQNDETATATADMIVSLDLNTGITISRKLDSK